MSNFEIMTNHLTSAFTNNMLKSKRNAQRDENTVILKWNKRLLAQDIKNALKINIFMNQSMRNYLAQKEKN